ncbi:MAG: methyltransferase domain-containing protein [Candidatus Omnitrophica bacterium]|nr:methyltransferase domain-containing protein [Candidatus Omnitrophota bacterium]
MIEEDTKWEKYGESRLLSRNKLLYIHHRIATESFLDHFKKVDTASKVLDVGCGDGLYLELLRDLGFSNAEGIDPGASMVSTSKGKNLNVRQGYLSDISGAEEYDVVYMMDVLEHIPDVPGALAAVNRILRPGGEFVLNIPICDSLRSRWRRFFGKETRSGQVLSYDETHLHAFTKVKLEELLKQAGFEVITSKRINDPMPFSGWLFSFSPKLAEMVQKISFGGRMGDFLFTVARRTG